MSLILVSNKLGFLFLVTKRKNDFYIDGFDRINEQGLLKYHNVKLNDKCQ